jgi:GT2 family glycosyltransferase
VDKDWLCNIQKGAAKWPQVKIFGGRIVPSWPNELPPSWKDAALDFFDSAYCVADWKHGEQIYPVKRVWGACMVLRREILELGWEFNESIGPQGGNYIMGSETEFLLRLSDAGFEAVYLPNVLVHHQIRTEQLELPWIKRRAFLMGRAIVVEDTAQGYIKFFGFSRYQLKVWLLQFFQLLAAYMTFNRKKIIAGHIALSQTEGKLYQLRYFGNNETRGVL